MHLKDNKNAMENALREERGGRTGIIIISKIIKIILNDGNINW